MWDGDTPLDDSPSLFAVFLLIINRSNKNTPSQVLPNRPVCNYSIVASVDVSLVDCHLEVLD